MNTLLSAESIFTLLSGQFIDGHAWTRQPDAWGDIEIGYKAIGHHPVISHIRREQRALHSVYMAALCKHLLRSNNAQVQ